MSEPFVSYAQNAEDVLLWRALHDVLNGTYVDVGAGDPVLDSVTAAFYQRGWRGLNVEPVPDVVAALRQARPNDVTIAAAAGAAADAARSLWVIEDSGLSTLVASEAARTVVAGRSAREMPVTVRPLDDLLDEGGFDGRPLHFCKVDVEGAEAEVLAGFSLGRWRPWVLVMEATRPNSTEPSHEEWEPAVLAAGYRFAVFDGLNRFYVAEEHASVLERLRAPVNVLDQPWERFDRQRDRLALEAQAARSLQRAEGAAAAAAAASERLERASASWDRAGRRAQRVNRAALVWRARYAGAAPAIGDDQHRLEAVQAELEAVRQTKSWRVTAPLRRTRRVLDRVRPRPVTLEEEPTIGRPAAADEVEGPRRARPARRGEPSPAPLHLPGPCSPDVADYAARERAAVRRLEVVTGLLCRTSLAPPADAVANLETAADRFEQVSRDCDLPPPTLVWLAWLAARGTYPTEDELDRMTNRWRIEGPGAVVGWLRDEARHGSSPGALAEAVVVDSRVLVDVTHTANDDLHTGVQRVVREAAVRWQDNHGAVLFTWDYARQGAAAMTGEELERFRRWRDRLAREPRDCRGERAGDAVLVPWRCTVIIPEIAAEPDRTARYRALARSRILQRLAGVGHDLIPVAAAETVDLSVSEVFTDYLSVVKQMDRVAAVSQSSAAEFRNFARMLPSQGLEGPKVAACTLATEVPDIASDAIERARDSLCIDSLPLVLVVGSHEPRKNHVTVLVAAERLWRAGHAFHLVFIGGSGWRSESFDRLLLELQAKDRPVQVIKRAAEETLWAAYRLARFTVFPSLTEGYGLPAAESLAAGTPLITSSFGSMAELAAGGGAMVVDPRDPFDLEAVMARLLTDDSSLEDLRRQAAGRRWKTWDEYAHETWEHLAT